MASNRVSVRLVAEVTATKVVDLSHPMYEGMPFWPGGVPFTVTRLRDYPQGCQYHKFEFAENTGTHVDAPSHFVPRKRSIDRIPLEHLVAPAVVIEVASQAATDPDYRLSAADLYAWEAMHGRIAEGCLVFVNTCWSKRFSEPERYLNRGADGKMHFPGLSADAAHLLVQRGVAGVGIDTPSIDYGPSRDFVAHKILLAADIYQIENLANLDVLPVLGATVVVGVLNVQGGSEAQARVFGLLP
jgi:kynurenine formamidase